MGMALGGWAEEEEQNKPVKCTKEQKCNCDKCRKERWYDSPMTLRDDD